MRPNGKVAVITGGNRGIGKGISIALGQQGIVTAIIYYTNQEEASATVTYLKDKGCIARSYQADVSNPDQVQNVFQQIISDFGRVDILINNAGVASKYATVDLNEAEWDRIIDINLKGCFLCSKAALPFMLQQGTGRIINISSIAGQTGGQIGPHYAASKAGIIGLTRFMAHELGPAGITVNAVAPSGIPTELISTSTGFPSADRPVQRVGTPEDVANAVCFLASDSASYITGQVLSVNGGRFLG